MQGPLLLQVSVPGITVLANCVGGRTAMWCQQECESFSGTLLVFVQPLLRRCSQFLSVSRLFLKVGDSNIVMASYRMGALTGVWWEHRWLQWFKLFELEVVMPCSVVTTVLPVRSFWLAFFTSGPFPCVLVLVEAVSYVPKLTRVATSWKACGHQGRKPIDLFEPHVWTVVITTNSTTVTTTV